MKIKILIPIAEGTEEIEAVTAIDLFRRAGYNTIVAGEKSTTVCSRGTIILADKLIDEIDKTEEFDLIYLPGGGKGTENMINNKHLKSILADHIRHNGAVAAICAAPLILDAFGLLAPNTVLTSHPSVEKQLAKYNYVERNFVVNVNVYTSRGAGTAMEFVLELIKKFSGTDTSNNIAKSILYKI